VTPKQSTDTPTKKVKRHKTLPETAGIKKMETLITKEKQKSKLVVQPSKQLILDGHPLHIQNMDNLSED